MTPTPLSDEESAFLSDLFAAELRRGWIPTRADIDAALALRQQAPEPLTPA